MVSNYENPKITSLSLILVILNDISSQYGRNLNSSLKVS